MSKIFVNLPSIEEMSEKDTKYLNHYPAPEFDLDESN